MEPKPLILLVDDNPAVADLVSGFLKIANYEVVVASSGEEALRKCEELSRPLDLLITDVIMPGISGPGLCERMIGDCRVRACLLISGYSEEVLNDVIPGENSIPLLAKPFTMNQLLETVRGILARTHEEGSRPPTLASGG
jgi:two-component system, cell cycle sensor histidine kinase and response regulator CckA